jgi:hypothetical protein
MAAPMPLAFTGEPVTLMASWVNEDCTYILREAAMRLGSGSALGSGANEGKRQGQCRNARRTQRGCASDARRRDAPLRCGTNAVAHCAARRRRLRCTHVRLGGWWH